jgi:hypothetical protein
MFDRRCSSRYPCQWQGTIVLTGTRRSVTVVDLSMAGALVRPTGYPDRGGLARGSRCAIRILSAEGLELLVLPATVAHSAGSRIGLAMARVEPAAQRMLHQLIEFNLGITAFARRDAEAGLGAH